MKKDYSRKNIIVGVFILLALIILLMAVFLLGGQRSTFVKKFTVNTVFTDVNGLKTGDNVWLSGMKIGYVKKMDFNENATVIISLVLDKKAKKLIHRDSKVKISSDGLMGNKVIVIYGGSAQSPLISENDYLYPAPSENGTDMLETLSVSNRNLAVITANLKDITNAMRTGKGSVSMLLNDSATANNIKYATRQLNNVLAGLKESISDVKIVVSRVKTVTEKLQQKGGLVDDIISDTAVFPGIRESVLAARSVIDSIDVIVANVKTASNALNKSDSPVGFLLNDSTSGQHIASIVLNLDTASLRLKEDLEALQHNFLLRGYFKKKNRKN